MATLAPTPSPMYLHLHHRNHFTPSTTLLTSSENPTLKTFPPSIAELARAITLLDMNSDGKIWATDLDFLLEVAFGVDARLAGGSWREVKRDCETYDGLLSLQSVLRAVEFGVVQSEVANMAREQFSPSDGSFRAGNGGAQSPLSSFSSIVEYVETFNRFDTDHNGVICAKDLREALLGFTGVEFTVGECKEMIRKVDSSFNGVVELNEFGALMRSLMQI